MWRCWLLAAEWSWFAESPSIRPVFAGPTGCLGATCAHDSGGKSLAAVLSLILSRKTYSPPPRPFPWVPPQAPGRALLALDPEVALHALPPGSVTAPNRTGLPCGPSQASEPDILAAWSACSLIHGMSPSFKTHLQQPAQQFSFPPLWPTSGTVALSSG